MLGHVNIFVYGRVQGVDFRHSAKQKAEELGISGIIKNMTDGSIYIEAEGEEDRLGDFLKWCMDGPPLAIVEKIDYLAGNIKHFEGFEII